MGVPPNPSIWMWFSTKKHAFGGSPTNGKPQLYLDLIIKDAYHWHKVEGLICCSTSLLRNLTQLTRLGIWTKDYNGMGWSKTSLVALLMCISMQMYVHMYIFVHIHTCMHTLTPTYIHIYICTYVHIYIYTYIHIYIYTYIHIYIHTHIYI